VLIEFNNNILGNKRELFYYDLPNHSFAMLSGTSPTNTQMVLYINNLMEIFNGYIPCLKEFLLECEKKKNMPATNQTTVNGGKRKSRRNKKNKSKPKKTLKKTLKKTPKKNSIKPSRKSKRRH